MMMLHRVVVLMFVASVVAISALGCASEVVDRPTTTASPTSAGGEELGNHQDSVLVSLKLSDTHTVNFLENESGGFAIEEELHADIDLASNPEVRSVTTMESMDGMGLADVYRYVAQEAANAEDIEILEAADSAQSQRLAESLELAAAYAMDPNNISDPPSIENELETGPVELPEDYNAEDTGMSEKGCTTPSWDWVADNFWFLNHSYCSNKTWWGTMGTTPNRYSGWQYGWTGDTSYFRSTGFAQAFCNTARYVFQYKSYTPGAGWGSLMTPRDRIIQPRYLYTYAKSTDDWFRYWYCYSKTVHAGGNQPIRVSMCVRHVPQ